MADEPSGHEPQEPTARAITRRDFETVIRRAAELSADEAESRDESLSEEEAVRIATELGLPARYVRQALFELPQISPDSSRADEYFGESVLTATRVVPGEAVNVLRRIEDYLTTREFLQVVRRRAEHAFLMPADDAISNLVRGLARPSRRFYLSRAHRVVLSVRSLEEKKAHVQISLDLSVQRRNALRGGWIGGTIGGLAIGAAGAVAVGFADLGAAVTVAGQVVAFAAGFAGAVTAALAAARSAFRSRIAGARFELDGLLDRAEQGQSLEPPPAPWRKRLQQKLLGHG